MNIELKRLSEVPIYEIIHLMNNSRVREQMPLARETFDHQIALDFVKVKEQLWQDHGYGPWGLFIDKQFAGWGGLQPEMGEVDLCLVLHPTFWGSGKSIVYMILKKAFREMKKESVIILFPTTRTRTNGILRLGFKQEKEIDLHGERFILYRLSAKHALKYLPI
jgi:[ribosomal protein S5]-alanine N-acetyltransferase